jgi:hypothetical protein
MHIMLWVLLIDHRSAGAEDHDTITQRKESGDMALALMTPYLNLTRIDLLV